MFVNCLVIKPTPQRIGKQEPSLKMSYAQRTMGTWHNNCTKFRLWQLKGMRNTVFWISMPKIMRSKNKNKKRTRCREDDNQKGNSYIESSVCECVIIIFQLGLPGFQERIVFRVGPGPSSRTIRLAMEKGRRLHARTCRP